MGMTRREWNRERKRRWQKRYGSSSSCFEKLYVQLGHEFRNHYSQIAEKPLDASREAEKEGFEPSSQLANGLRGMLEMHGDDCTFCEDALVALAAEKEAR